MSPIKPKNRELYPDDWDEISREIRFCRAAGRCECTGECGSKHHGRGGRCGAQHGTWIQRHDEDPAQFVPIYPAVEEALPGPYSKPVRVVLTVAHLDHDPRNCAPENLLAMCQRCHLVYDAAEHARSRRRSRHQGQCELWGGDDV